LGYGDQALLRQLAAEHELRLYRFSAGTHPLGAAQSLDDALPLLEDLAPAGRQTQVVRSLRTVLDDLQGQRLAGIVLLTDGRETPTQAQAEQMQAVKDFGVRIYPVVVGSDEAPRNVAVTAIDVQDTVFKDDIVSVTA